MNYWLLKSEPDVFGIEHLVRSPQQTTSWEGVRNYQARNLLRDQIKQGDQAFFYHSSCPEPGIAAIVEVVRGGYPDPAAWRRNSPYFDAKSLENKPVWHTVDVKLQRRFKAVIPLTALRMHAESDLQGMWLLRPGNRLSVMPVDRAHWKFILALQ